MQYNQYFLVFILEQKVFINVLMVIKVHHIERLLKKFDLGTQIMFEHKLSEWRTLMGAPLYNNSCDISDATSLQRGSPSSE